MIWPSAFGWTHWVIAAVASVARTYNCYQNSSWSKTSLSFLTIVVGVVYGVEGKIRFTSGEDESSSGNAEEREGWTHVWKVVELMLVVRCEMQCLFLWERSWWLGLWWRREGEGRMYTELMYSFVKSNYSFYDVGDGPMSILFSFEDRHEEAQSLRQTTNPWRKSHRRINLPTFNAS